MEGRERQDASVVRRSGTFLGRQVPLEMGKVRVGGSGKPVPAVFSTAASRRARSASLEADAVPLATLSPRVSIEPHPRSPFRRKEELSMTVVRVSEDSLGSGFQVKKVTGPYLSARSPQLRSKSNRISTGKKFAPRSAEMKTSRMNLSRSGESSSIAQIEQLGKTSQVHDQVATSVVKRLKSSEMELSTRDHGNTSAAGLLPTEEQEEESAIVPEEKALKANSENIRPPKSPGRTAVALQSTGAGTFVSSMPSLTKLQSSFTARELALFTRRRETSEPEGNAQTRYHVASHPHATTAVTSSPVARVGSEEKRTTHKRALPSSKTDNLSSEEKRQGESSWKRVDTSIDHIYEDPSIDMVQLHLLHSHNTVNGQKKRKMVERERVLAAASDLREHQSEEQRRKDQLQQRKLQLQKMSEAIRLQNQRAVRARAAYSSDLNERRVKSDRRSESAPSLPERKPPVPRLSRAAKPHQSKRKKKARDEDPRPQGGVSTSILMGSMSSSSVTATQQEKAAIVDEGDISLPAEHHAVKRRPPSTTPRSSKKKKQGVAGQTPEAEAATRAREERRAIAREYMQLQKHSRRIWNAQAKEQSQLEQDKRQQQLQILEATRLRNLRASKKRSMDRKKYEMDDPVATGDPPRMTVAVASSSPIMPDISIDTPTQSGFLSEASRSVKEFDLDESQLDKENDQTRGNFRTSECSSICDTELVNFEGKPKINAVSKQEASQNAEAEERVRKLLELREKAAALSARLIGLRNRTNTTATMETSKEIVEQNLIIEAKDMAEPANDVFQASASETGNNALADDGVHSEHGSEHKYEHEHEHDADDGERRKHDDSSNGSEAGSDKAASRYGDSSLRELEATRMTSDVEIPQNRVVDDEEKSMSVTRTRQNVQYNQVFVDGPDSFGMYDVSDGEDIDIRSIGVHNIGVVWPIQQQNNETTHGVSENQTTEFPSSSSSSSSSSALSSTSVSPAISRREQWLANLGESRDEQMEDNEEAFEVAFYQQLKDKLNAPQALNDGETKETNDRRETEENDLDSDGEADLESTAIQRKLYPVDRGAKQGRENSSSKARHSSAGLMRLIRETDDSLSVIDRAAKKLYHEQLERSEREKEKELQERMEAEKKNLLEKDLALQAVMASITGKKSISEADSDVDAQSSGDEDELQSSQYKRLEEIMAEVEKERAQETEENIGRDESTANKDERQSKEESKPPRFKNTRTSVRHRDGMPVSPSSAFWDQLVAETTENEFESASRPHVAIDDSELVAQRESRLRDDDERTIDSPPRVHSPRTLSQRLMAAVDYQEAIFEAHIQLSMMEHAHELETVQAETITLAQAFKEEMEDNATSHQLALDHATLEKKFDSDMQDVMQQLDTIRQAEEQERAATEARLEQELKVANLRECSVQTESSQRADAATSAALCVDTSTSPIRFGVDAAVQNGTIEQKTGGESPVAASNHGMEYASEESDDVYDETFENQNQVQVDQQIGDKTSISDVPSVVESLTNSSPKSESDRESEIQSVLSDQAGDNYEESSVANSVAYEESFAEESAAVSAVKSTVDDEVHESESIKPVKRKADESVSVSMDYDDDFEASSPTMKASVSRMSQGTVEDDVEDELEVSRSSEHCESGGDIEEEVDSESDSVKADEEAVSEDVKSDYYSSQFDDTSRGDSKMTKKMEIKNTAPVVQGSGKSIVQTQGQRSVAGELGLNARRTTDSVSAAYILDLERRKQAEESLLDLRLQTVEQKYQHEVKQLENTMGDDDELKLREETLTVAFLAEKANVENLKAASTARYYQDLHSFRSLSLGWPHAVGRGSDGRLHPPFFSEHIAGFVPSAVAWSVAHPIQSKSPTHVDDERDVSTRRDEYTDEFASDPENGGKASVEEKNNGNSTEAESRSIVSEHSESRSIASEYSDIDDDAKEPSDAPETSEVAEEEEDFEQENEKVKAVSVQEEEEQYEDEFVSMSENFPAQKDIVVDAETAEIAESTEVAEPGEQDNEDSIHGDSEYDEDFASVSESIQHERPDLSNSSVVEETEIKEQNAEEHMEASELLKVSENEVPTTEHKEVLQTPSVMSKLFGKNAIDRSPMVEESYDDEYEAESFDEGQNDGHKTSEIASDEADQVEDEDGHRNDEMEGEDSNFEVASEAPSHQSDSNEDVVPSVVDEEEHVVNEQEASGSKTESDDYENDYENEYENESFGEGQSVPDSLPEYGDGDVSMVEENPVEDISKEEDTLEKSGNDFEDVYSEEAFDSTSESFTNEAEVSPNKPEIIELATSEIMVATEEMSIKEKEFTEAIKLRDERDTNPVSHSELEPDHAESALNESKLLASSVSVSLSRSDEAESFTKSIEERTARLEALKQQIEDRKTEILAVQKQMRVERRREKIVAEEKLLWDEMESVQRLLRADEEALALCRQRNRVEIMHLEARQLENSVDRKPNKNVYESDLLLGFDYIEEAQIVHNQQRYLSNMSRWGHTIRGFDLLDGYTYIETAESGDSNAFESTDDDLEFQEAKIGFNEGKSGAADYEHGMPTAMEEPLGAVYEEKNSVVQSDESDESIKSDDNAKHFTEATDDRALSHEPTTMDTDLEEQGDNCNYAVIQQETGIQQSSESDIYDESLSSKRWLDSLEQQATVDLLAEYAYVEIAETVYDAQSEVQNADLLVGFDYVEIVKPVEIMPTDDTTPEQMLGTADNIGATHDEAISGPGDTVYVKEEEIASVFRVEDCSSDSESSRKFNEDDGISREISPATVSSIRNLTQGSSVGFDNEETREVSAEYEYEEEPHETNDGSDQVLQSERMADAVFATVFEEVISSELQLWSRRHPIDVSISGAQADEHEMDSEEVEDASILSVEGSVIYADSFDEESSHKFKEDGDISRETLPSQTFSNRNSAQDVTSSMEFDKQEDVEVSAEYESEEPSETNDSPDKEVLQCERVVDAIFATVFDEVVSSELQIWSRRKPIDKSTISPQAPVKASGITPPPAVKSTPESKKPIPRQDQRARDLTLARRIMDQLEIVDGQVRLPAFNTFAVGNDSNARVMYDAVEDLARDCFSAIQQSLSNEHTLDNASVLSFIHHHVQREIEELLMIRAQAEHELERQLQLISDESGAETGLTTDGLLSQNCITSNVSSIVAKVQSDISRTTEKFSIAVQSARPTIPRTPISRARSTSILSSLQTQQDEELQQRITGMILSDLLHDAGLS
ncbi:hypothetical protein PI125_g10795 [Phytophthora idaei]|nr:hypothetical protein PI125_g10795 [Phytophthora idaei]KAG3153279.1 hypothetical protein PI126_g10155 [Phytophthora idaei]